MSEERENNIKKYIDKSGYKSNYIANQVGCFPSDISHYIAGNRMPNRERLKKLSKILKCRMKDLYPNIKYSVTYKV